ncbi:MAG: hypothetical protein IJ409_06675 [Lachnospiraceae bacterium]|nr:hypothetical protein [Lachnospiraceae bacterium]
MKKAVKGNFGYLSAKRTQVIIRTVIFFAISAALYIAGYVTTGSNKNLLTIVAVLGLLPASKSLVNMIMLIRATGCSNEAREAVEPLEGRLIGMYDMYFTSYKMNFAISHMIVEGKVILGYTEDAKCDCRACEEHLDTMLKQGGFKDITIRISDDLNTYCEQLKNLNAKEQENNPEKDDEVRVVLYDISL